MVKFKRGLKGKGRVNGVIGVITWRYFLLNVSTMLKRM